MSRPIAGKLPDAAVRQELERVLESPVFLQSERLCRFLRFAVERALEGQEESLKEYVIGTEVYDRRPPYHPSQDSIVRTEARRLRSKLKEYYESEGKDDPIYIFFRPGSYAPVFRMKDSGTSYQVTPGNPQDDLYVEGVGVSVAVIPFVDISGQPLSSRCALGVTDELIHEIAQSDGCRVLSAHSVAHADSQSLDIPSLARNLGVQVVFEGTVREIGNRIRVAARVISADGFQLWSQRLDAEADSSNLLVLQEQFASALVSRVRPQLSFVRTADASVSQTLLAAYPAVLKGESLLEDGTIADIQEALIRFREVEQATPGYPRVFCGISRCHAWMALHGARNSREHVSQARISAEMAIKLDPQMTESLIAMGTVHGLEWQWEEAQENCLKAAEQRSHAAGNRQFAVLSTQLGRFDQAGLHLERAQRIDPFSYQQKTAWASFFYLSRRFEEALQYFTEPLRYGPLPRDARLYLALIHAELGRHDAARQIAKELQISVGADLPSLGWIAEVYARCEDRAAAEAIVEKFDLLSDGADLSRYRQARLAMALGIKDLALALLNSSYTEEEPELPYVAVEQIFDPIRQVPQFADLIRKVHSAGAE